MTEDLPGLSPKAAIKAVKDWAYVSGLLKNVDEVLTAVASEAKPGRAIEMRIEALKEQEAASQASIKAAEDRAARIISDAEASAADLVAKTQAKHVAASSAVEAV